jgi:hypothetical protein
LGRRRLLELLRGFLESRSLCFLLEDFGARPFPFPEHVAARRNALVLRARDSGEGVGRVDLAALEALAHFDQGLLPFGR